MADAESKFVEVWEDWWAKYPVPTQLVVAGSVRRLDVGALMGKIMPKTEQDGVKLLDGIGKDLKTVLADKKDTLFWSPAPGLIDIFYPKLLPQAADLSHSVIRSAIERRVRETIVTPAASTATKMQSVAERHLDWESFQRVCQKMQARADQIQTIDISELALGMADPKVHLPRRLWKAVDEIVDEYMANGGYCTRYPGNLLLLFFPGLSVTLARLKRRSIAADIENKDAALARLQKSSPKDGDEAETEEKHAPALPRVEPAGENADEIARLNKAFAAMAAAPGISGLNQDELTIPSNVLVRMVPVWRAGNQTLVGHSLVPHSARSNSEFATLGLAPEALDLPLLAHAQADVLGRTESQNPYLVIVPVHWRSLERNNARSKYLELCTRLPEELRRYLVLTLREIPEDLMGARIEECIRDLKRFCRAVMCRVDLTRRNFDQFAGLSLHAIGAQLAASGAIEKHAMAEMDGFLDAIEPLRSKTFIEGLQSKSLVIAALAAGFDYLSGSAIVIEAGTLGVRSFSIPDLYDAGESTSAAVKTAE